MHPRRKRREGAVLVESLIVSLVLTTLLAGVVLAHALYAAKIGSEGRARAEAWQRALPGCEGGTTQAVLGALGGPAFEQVVTADGYDMVDAPAWVSDLGRAIGAPPPVTVSAGAALGGTAVRVQSRIALACNEYGDDAHGGLLTNTMDLVRQLIPGISDR